MYLAGRGDEAACGRPGGARSDAPDRRRASAGQLPAAWLASTSRKAAKPRLEGAAGSEKRLQVYKDVIS